ncbi:MAG: class II glutamine amidotransferase [Pseudomonadota bacterium]
MCRLAAYVGPERPLSDVIMSPPHGLIAQASQAEEAKFAVNGDGFGVAWYGQPEVPGLYRDALPAWSDGNLPSLCQTICSRLFLAHVRAGTYGETSRLNCHPFVNGRWAFMHNGQCGGFAKGRRVLESLLPDVLYLARKGTTDSELFFLLMLANGLDRCPVAAFHKTYEQVRSTCNGPVRCAIVISDGTRIWAFRYASDGRCPTLYASERFDSGGQVVASEPLDQTPANWSAIGPNSHAVFELRHPVNAG